MNFFKIKYIEKFLLSLVLVALLFLPLKDSLSSAQAESLTQDQNNIFRQVKTNRFLNRIDAEISSGENDLLLVKRSIAETQANIQATEKKMYTLKDQIENLDLQIKSSQTIIENIENQIAKKQSDIDTLKYEIAQKKIEISYQKQLVMEYLEVLFKDQNELGALGTDEDTLNTFKLLLSNDSAGSKLRSIRYSEVLERQGRDIFNTLDVLMEEQKANQKILEVKKHNLIIYHQTLTEEQQELEVTKKAKTSLMKITKGQESIYKKLFSDSKSEEKKILSDLGTLRKNLIYVQERRKMLGDKFDPADYADLLNVGDNKLLLSHLIDEKKEGFYPIWPVAPSRGISAYFHDPAYAKMFGRQHNAIDIRARQGTPVKSVEDGVVYKAKDNGYGYSYIMVAHDGGYMTLYGHISKILVAKGDFLKQGDVIGLSGATPGTKGAGPFTTGPHLHFEVMKDGVHTDPLNSLDLAYLDLASLPEQYVSKAVEDRKKARRIELKKVKYTPPKEKIRVSTK